MKELILLAMCLALGLTARAQGTIVFANAAPGVNAPIFDVDGTTRLSGPAYAVDLWYGPAGIAPSDVTNPNLQSLGLAVPFRTGAAAGYFLGGTVTFPNGVTGPTSLQVRAWRVADGATWVAASTAPGGYYYVSQVIQAVLVNPPTPPNIMIGLSSFTLIPEPLVVALGLLGVGGLVLFRRCR